MKIDDLNAYSLSSSVLAMLEQAERAHNLIAQLAPPPPPDLSKLTPTGTWPALPTCPLGLGYLDTPVPGYAELSESVSQAGLLGRSQASTNGLLGLDYLAARIPDFQKLFPPASARLAVEDLLKASHASIPYLGTPAPYVGPSAASIAALSAATPDSLFGGALNASHMLHDLSSIGLLSAQLSSSITASSGWATAFSDHASASTLVSSLQGLTRSADRAAVFLRELPTSHEIFAAGFPYTAPYFEGFTGSHVVERLAKRSADGESETESRARIVEKIEDSTSHDIVSLLSDLGGEFLPQMLGARAARRSSNPDKSRHVCVSLRELLSGVLHELTPDEEVVPWLKGRGLIDGSKPTRRGRLFYVCRHINSGACNEFVESDVNLTLTLFHTLHVGTHGRQRLLSDSQLDALVLRVETQLVFLLRLSRGA